MKFITHNQDNLINRNMTHLQGVITCSYTDLVSTFGEPMAEGFDDYKSDAEWVVQFEDGTVATIYNWKNGKNYCGDEGQAVQDIREWHVGGHTGDATVNVRQALREGV
jgi:hypothetical protein